MGDRGKMKWFTFSLLPFSPNKTGVIIESRQGCITSSHILLIFITQEALFFSWRKQEEKTYIHLKVSFLYHHKALFLNYNSFQKFLSNKKNLVVLWLLLYKFCKNNNETWFGSRLLKKLFNLKLVGCFRDTIGRPESAISRSCIGIGCEYLNMWIYWEYFLACF